ncbi:MAG TPA: histidinol phosphate phosphatase domain-containing protein [Syntrophorhabdaceae bacterium]|nr:histidinol phosphate phosphatase domain-containing protein [Syntrophorhabdaceae bacterium]HOL06007.1 histidinol phosphate phosphatase domain-containing protein [Syntrophorhabdaceae bacterium]HON85406.1 histidinol phosphate phosphatase domain-containing protein [Syntrophorhabdaceae bacterium]HPC66995.1 histidinol phosphate phosphatase domain-containing protein [Syntrophorhabdaceae bacterium]HPP42422.1 histidinol phosphate phosphatase domain-containing protein [Syntrophorhabdaceae bacterium]
MIDLHTHSLLSDGELLPSELARRAKVKGYSIIGISDHVDPTNLEDVATSILKLAAKASSYNDIMVVPGVELTHVPPDIIGELVKEARRLGIYYVVVHGETIAEPVEEGTNRSAIEAGADILAHPGLISMEDMGLAAKKGVLIEISARKGHSLTNGHVAALAKKTGARLVLDTDSHSPSDLITDSEGLKIVMGAGLSRDDFHIMQRNAEELARRVFNR